MTTFRRYGDAEPCPADPSHGPTYAMPTGRRWCPVDQRMYSFAEVAPATRSAPDDEKSGTQARFTSSQFTDAAEATTDPGDRNPSPGLWTEGELRVAFGDR